MAMHSTRGQASNRSRRGRDRTREALPWKQKIAFVLPTLIAFVTAGYDAAADGSVADAHSRYRIRAVRIEHASAAVIYRLDSATGEVCAFSFVHRNAGVARGCVDGIAEKVPGRFELDAVQGSRGTIQTSAYRIDRSTGEVCRFRIEATGSTPLEAVECIGRSSAGAVP